MLIDIESKCDINNLVYVIEQEIDDEYNSYYKISEIHSKCRVENIRYDFYKGIQYKINGTWFREMDVFLSHENAEKECESRNKN